MDGWDGIPAIATHPWACPALEVVPIVGIGLLPGNLVPLELRVWGAAPVLPLRALARAARAVALSGFALAAGGGLEMFAAAPGALLANRALAVKMGLLMLARLKAGLFHARGGLARPDGWARAQRVLSIGLWLAVIVCGRWIAYL